MATWALAYLGGWLVSSAIAFVAARHLGDRRLPTVQTLALSLLAGAVWPLLVLGAIEVSSVAALSAARSWRKPREIPESWMTRTPEGVLSLR
jgi:hypothetical protein